MLITQENYRTIELGAKARNLFLLTEAGFPVPPFFCVDEQFSEKEVSAHLDWHFPDTSLFSVRSCASLEDSVGHSFAGQFQTFLRVPKEDICSRIRDVLSDAAQPETLSYCRAHHLDPSALKMHVIIQEMIEADLSGILFTANPQGPLNESVIVCGAGCGDLVVEDRTDTTAYYYNLSDKVYYYEQTGSSALLSHEQVEELIGLSQRVKERIRSFRQAGDPADLLAASASAVPKVKAESFSDTELDMEFAIKNNTCYLLQTRPITTLNIETPVIILDNSNIVESYPGITLPMTQSFIREAYYQVFRNLLIHLTGEPKTVSKIDDALHHMVDAANGRIYYRISNWYDVLLFLPFSHRLIPIWQEMMGVKEKTVSSGMQNGIRRTTRLKVACSFFRLLLTCPKEMDKLDLYFQEIIEQFDSLDIHVNDNRILLEHYRSLQEMTVKRWDMTLVNDMYGFLFTGLLKNRLKAKHVPDPELAANRAISGIGGLESMRPIQELQKLALQAEEENLIPELKGIDSNESYTEYIKNNTCFSLKMQEYIQKFGDRNVEELKLESKTFRTDPVLLVRCILQYAESSTSSPEGSLTGNSTNHPAQCSIVDTKPTPESVDAVRLTGLAAFYAKRAAAGIRNREKSRLNRGRLYGMMRSLVLQMGQNLYKEHRIAEPEDIFWLYCEEIDAASDPSGRAPDLRRIISGRKKEYEGFSRLPAFSRLVFSGKITDKHPQSSQKMRYVNADGTYAGIPCSSGTAEGEVLCIDTPSPGLDTRGRILVTKMTDPGWVFLIAPAKAIVSEKGSLLSHTAIISRELGKPAVVSVEHITEYLKTGDRVRVDGDSGTITLLPPK